jgi:hypothetical protein
MKTTIEQLPSLNDLKKLPAENITEFREKGHTLIKEVLSAEEIAAYRPVIVGAAKRYNTEKRKLQDRDTYGKAFLQIMNLWRVDEDAKKFVLAKMYDYIMTRHCLKKQVVAQHHGTRTSITGRLTPTIR